MSRLLVNADDFGLHTAVNEAIADCVKAGSVNSISVMVNGLVPQYDVLKDLSVYKVKTGAHISWVGEKWLTRDYLIHDWKALLTKVMLSAAFRKEMAQEAEAQVQLLLENGLILHHIDSHQHVHVFPGVWPIVAELAAAYKIQQIRVPKVLNASVKRSGIAGSVLDMLAAQHDNDRKSFYCAGIRNAGNYDIQKLDMELQQYTRHDTLLIVHPGNSNAQLNNRYNHWKFDWEKEYQALKDPAFRETVSKYGFEMA